MVKIYKQPFAHGGDAIAIPDASQPDGKMSSADGWTPDYQLPKTDPNYKPVGRQEMNGVFKEVTEALGQVQVQGAASWSADGAPYPINAQVYHSGKQWIALRANGVAPTDGADWAAIGTAATATLTTSTTDGTVGRVLRVADGGWMGRGASQATPYEYPANENDVTNQTKVIRSYVADNGVPPFAAGIHFASGDAWGRLRVSYDTTRAWIQGGNANAGTGWTSQVVLSGNLLQTTGSSTALPMSQKAVTDAFGQSSIAGSCTTNGTTDNTLVLTGIVSALALELGDVIQITGSTGGLNDKLFTVESITDVNSIIVNYEHAGNRGNGSLKLADQTATVTIKRIAKWYNAPLGLGQAWVSVVSAGKSISVNYTNTTGRAIVVSIGIVGSGTPSFDLMVDGVVASYSQYPGGPVSLNTLQSPISTGSVYSVQSRGGTFSSIRSWSELR